MEFLRFGSSIPGAYWGCCAADIIQNFKVDPDAPASISIVDGDGGTFLQKFAGMTYREIFEARLRFGTFSTRDMPNHAFFAILAKSQLSSEVGKKWLKILKEHGFEFIRTVNNSVWNADNFVFALFRNNGPNAVKDQFTPPKEWTDLPSNGKTELWETVGSPYSDEYSTVNLTKQYADVDQKVWDKIGPAKLYTQAEVEAKGVPVVLAAMRSPFPPQGPNKRKETIEKYVKGFGTQPGTHHRYPELDPVKPATPAAPPQMEA